MYSNFDDFSFLFGSENKYNFEKINPYKPKWKSEESNYSEKLIYIALRSTL